MQHPSPRESFLPALTLAALLALGAALAVTGAGRVEADSGPPLRGAFEEGFKLMERPVPAPIAAVETAEGTEVSLADFEGRVVLVNFWATWCAPCVREMPSLDRLQAELGGQGLVVLAVSEDRNFAQIEGFYAEAKLLRLRAYLDKGGDMARAFEVRGLPTTILIDRDGMAVGGMQGPAEWDSEDAKALLRHYLHHETQPIKTSG